MNNEISNNTCPRCGMILVNGSIFCSNCGYNLNNNNNNNNLNTMTNTLNNQVVNSNQTNNNLKSNNKKNLFIIVGIILIIVGGIFAYNLIKGKNSNGNKNNVVVATISNRDNNYTLTSAITKVYGKYVPVETIKSFKNYTINGVSFMASIVEYETDNNHYTHYNFSTINDFKKVMTSKLINFDGIIIVGSIPQVALEGFNDWVQILSDNNMSNFILFLDGETAVSDEELINLIQQEFLASLDSTIDNGQYTTIVRGDSESLLDGDKSQEKKIKNLIKELEKLMA